MNQANQKRTTFNPRALKPGTVVPGTKWSYVRKLGEGGMGVVIEVVKPPSIRGAMKVMVPEMAGRKDHVERFLHEVNVLTMLDHENVVRVFDCDTLDDGAPYVVMELLRGSTLRGTLRALKQGMVAPAEVYDVARSVGAALECAHRAGIVHRDVKPDNVFIHESRPNTSRVVLLDFGVAALVEDARAIERSGTPLYMAPERYRGEPATPASDIYSFGLVIYEMLTGHLPWDVRGAAIRQTMRAHVHEPPSPPSRYAAWLPSSVEALILATLDKDPSRRPDNASVLAQDLYELQWCGSSPKRVADFNTTSPSMSTMIERSRAVAARDSMENRTDEGMRPPTRPSQPSHAVGGDPALSNSFAMGDQAPVHEGRMESPGRIDVDRYGTTPALTPPLPVRRATDTDVLLDRLEATAEGAGAARAPSEAVAQREPARGLPRALVQSLPAMFFIGTIAIGVTGLWAAGLLLPRRPADARPSADARLPADARPPPDARLRLEEVRGVPTTNSGAAVPTGGDILAAPAVPGLGSAPARLQEAAATPGWPPRSVLSAVALPESSSLPAPRPPLAKTVRRTVATPSPSNEASWPIGGTTTSGEATAARKGIAPKSAASATKLLKVPAQAPPDDGRELFEPVP